MQILECSVVGLRSARLTFRSSTHPTSVTLFPMVHIGEPGFYRQVFADAFAHDVVLVEGVNSPVAKRIARAYRLFARSPRLQLERQPSPPTDLGAEVVHADLSGPEFHAEWRKIALWIRILIYLLAPLAGLRMRGLVTRGQLAKALAMEDRDDRRGAIDWGPEGAALANALLDARDRRLIERLREELEFGENTGRGLAIIYGASHMRAVIRELTGKLGFLPAETSWITVFEC